MEADGFKLRLEGHFGQPLVIVERHLAERFQRRRQHYGFQTRGVSECHPSDACKVVGQIHGGQKRVGKRVAPDTCQLAVRSENDFGQMRIGSRFRRERISVDHLHRRGNPDRYQRRTQERAVADPRQAFGQNDRSATEVVERVVVNFLDRCGDGIPCGVFCGRESKDDGFRNVVQNAVLNRKRGMILRHRELPDRGTAAENGGGIVVEVVCQRTGHARAKRDFGQRLATVKDLFANRCYPVGENEFGQAGLGERCRTD